MRYCKSTIFQANHNTKEYYDQLKRLFAILQKYDFSSKSQPEGLHHRHGRVLFAILQKYDFSSKSQPTAVRASLRSGCLRYCKSTIFQANHNGSMNIPGILLVVCDTAKVRFFKQITTYLCVVFMSSLLFAILQKYDFSSKSQPPIFKSVHFRVVCDTAKVRFFKQITTDGVRGIVGRLLFAILQKYDFSSKSQPLVCRIIRLLCCLRYCKSTIFQANHNNSREIPTPLYVVCDTAKVRFFKQITTAYGLHYR